MPRSRKLTAAAAAELGRRGGQTRTPARLAAIKKATRASAASGNSGRPAQPCTCGCNRSSHIPQRDGSRGRCRNCAQPGLNHCRKYRAAK